MSVNKVILLGRLGQDVELKFTPAGNMACNFSVACSEKYKDKNGVMQEKTEWVNVVAWGKLAEICSNYLSKGREVYLEGKLQTRSWDAKDGSKRYTTEVLMNSVQFIGGSSENKTNNSQKNENSNAMSNNYSPEFTADFTADEIPF